MTSLHAISSGHPAATEITSNILEGGGNFVDAGIAACISLCVLHSELVQIGGISPIILKRSGSSDIVVIDGVGRWPVSASSRFFSRNHRGRIPKGVLRTVVPGAIAAWILALQNFGTMSFAELAAPALQLAVEGFPAHVDLVGTTSANMRQLVKYPENAKIWLKEGKPYVLGETVKYPELASLLKRLIEADCRARRTGGREAGLAAVFDLFYRGDVAAEMVRHVESNGGMLSAFDLSDPGVRLEKAISAKVSAGILHTCGPWSQGPSVSQALQLLDRVLDRNSCSSEGELIHLALEAIKLSLADREGFYGDPDFVNVPLDELLGDTYVDYRSGKMQKNKSYEGFPPPGLPGGWIPESRTQRRSQEKPLDTSVVCIADDNGNVFAATPSDSAMDAPAVPGLGFVVSTRGVQSFTEPGHPSIVEPRKRPRATACPMIFVAEDGRVLAGGGSGGDFQMQAMVQVLARHLFAGSDLSSALAKPRAYTQTAPSSSSPHLSFPGRVSAEESLDAKTILTLSEKGHVVISDASVSSLAWVCLVEAGSAPGNLLAFSDPRRVNATRVM